MLNPVMPTFTLARLRDSNLTLYQDGVILGSYRCNMSGVDLNRHYSQPSLKIAPEVIDRPGTP